MNAEPYPLHPVVNNVPNHTSPTLSRSDTITAPTSGILYNANKVHYIRYELQNGYRLRFSYQYLLDFTAQYFVFLAVLSGVPFQINSKLTDVQNLKNVSTFCPCDQL